jgi:hypothetical protein
LVVRQKFRKVNEVIEVMEYHSLIGTKGNRFLDENAVQEQMRYLLASGAALIYAYDNYDWTPQTLKIYSHVIGPEEVLNDYWYVHNKEEALRSIDGLLDVGGLGWVREAVTETRASIDERVSRRAAGDASALSAEESVMLADVEDLMVGYTWGKARITAKDIADVNTILAWDTERAAFIARMAYNCGFFSEEEVWSILSRTLEKARASALPDWLAYGVSFMKGMAIVKYDSDYSAVCSMWDNLCYLVDPKWGEVWAWQPLRDEK